MANKVSKTCYIFGDHIASFSNAWVMARYFTLHAFDHMLTDRRLTALVKKANIFSCLLLLVHLTSKKISVFHKCYELQI